jgi:hypothetical protein
MLWQTADTHDVANTTRYAQVEFGPATYGLRISVLDGNEVGVQFA